MPALEYKDHLLSDLKDPRYAAGYLTAALEEGEDVFLLAIRDVVQAQDRMAVLAKMTGLNRENLYAMLSREGNPRLSSITAILAELGFRIEFSPTPRDSDAA